MAQANTTPEQQNIQEVRDQLEELQSELEWTRQQHRRWAEEREALVLKIRELRTLLAESEAVLEAKQSAIEKLSAENAVLRQQCQVSQEQRELLADAFGIRCA